MRVYLVDNIKVIPFELPQAIDDFFTYNYFYHMALNGNCDEICEEGLCLADKNYYSSMIEITKEMRDVFAEYELTRGELARTEELIDKLTAISCIKRIKS